MLSEALSAGVYKSKDLIVITDLVKDEFHLNFSGDVDGTCLIIQTIYSMSAVSKIPAQDIVDSFKGDIPWAGLTLKQIFDHFSKAKILSNGKTYKFKLSLEEYTNLAGLIYALEKGQPTTMIIDAFSELRNAMDNTHDSEDGKVKVRSRDVSDSVLTGRKNGYHALLLIGYDKKEKFIIGREINNRKMFKGFFKISSAAIEKKFTKIGKYFGIVVESVSEVNSHGR